MVDAPDFLRRCMPLAVTLSPDELLCSSASHLAGLLGRSRHSKVEGQDQALQDTVLKDLREGFGTGPFSASELDAEFGTGQWHSM